MLKYFKTIPFVNMFIPVMENTSKGIYSFGKDNLLPNKLMRWVLDSGAAKRSLQKRSAYISADGFVDELNANKKVNAFETADKVLTQIAQYQAYFKGFVLHVKRSANGFEIKTLPFQDVRKRLDGKFSYNPTYSADKFDASKEQIIMPFLGNRTLTANEFALIKDKGEIIYAYHKSADNPNYPIPDYYAGIEDIRTSSELQKFDYESVLNAFLPSAILSLVGELDDVTKDANGMTEKDYFDESLEAFTGQVKDKDGVSGRMRLMVTTARTKDEAPILQTFDAKSIIDASNSKRDIVERSVCRLFGVHPVLVGYSDASVLGNQQALANASQELCNDVISDQQLITETFEQLYGGNWDITSFKPIQYIPDVILGKLSDNEQRALIGYPELPQLTTDARTLAEIIGVGGVQALTNILVDQLLTIEQKKGTLEVIFGLSPEDADKLLKVGNVNNN